eukprot:Em0012g596a
MRVCLAAQVLSSSVADALTLLDEDETMETRKFIRLMDKFFDCLNVRNTFHGTTTRNENLHPYTKCNDERLKWLKETFLGYFDEWEKEVKSLPAGTVTKNEKAAMKLSKETVEDLRITTMSLTELIPILLSDDDCKYHCATAFSMQGCAESAY